MAQTIIISEISFFTDSKDIQIKGKMFKDMLSYDSELFINHTQLNMVLNHFQKNNPEVDVMENLESVAIQPGTYFYNLSTTTFNNPPISLGELSFSEPIRQVRA